MSNNTNVSQSDVKNAYRFYAPIYDFIFGAVLEPGRQRLCKEVHRMMPSNLLEIGVGTGLLLPNYPNIPIHGIDISEEMLNIGRLRISKLANKSIVLTNMNAEDLSFKDNQFDCVVLPYVLSVTPNPSRLISEARRVCKKDGIIIIANHFSGNHAWAFLEKITKNLAAKIGFRSEFSYAENIAIHDWTILRSEKVNLFGLSKLITIQNSKSN